MVHKRRKIIGLLFTVFLFSLYCILPFLGAVSMVSVFAGFVICFCIFTAVCLLGYKALQYLLPKVHCKKIEAVIYGKGSDGIFFLVLWGILVLGWIPAYLAFFPGIFGYDSPNQMQQIMGEIPYSSHHPLLHTVFLGLLMKCGKAVFGMYNGGVALVCAFQGLVVSGSIAYSFRLMRKFRIPFPVFAVSYIWCIWNPVLQVLTFNTTKDILFGASLLNFVLNCYEWNGDRDGKKRRQCFLLILSGILVCLLRNLGIYVVAALLVICVFTGRRDKRFILALGSIVLSSQLFFYVSAHVLGVERADSREMLSVPIQQMTLVCSTYIGSGEVNLSAEEYEKFTELVEEEYMSDYHLSTADPIKSHFLTEKLKQNIPEYITLYIRVGLHNPGYYLMAFRCLVYPYWDMSEGIGRHLSIENTFPDITTRWGISQESLLPQYKEYLSDYIIYGMEEKIPFVSWLLQPGLCIWIMAALLGLSVAKSNKAVFWVAVTGMMLFLGTALGPVALMRYLYPLMILTPWFLALSCHLIDNFPDRTIVCKEKILDTRRFL